MHACTILSHQLAACTLFFYALLGIVFSAKRPPQSVKPKRTHLDVDLRYCTVEELEYVTVLLLTQAKNQTLSDAETLRFLAVACELERREVRNG
jgi:hypothetical protein